MSPLLFTLRRRPFASLALLLPLTLALETTDHWPNEYDNAHNLFTSVDDVPKTSLQFTNKPDWLSGDLYTIGPGKWSWGDKTYRGFSDAAATVTKVSFNENKEAPTFQRHMTQGVTYQANALAETIVISEMMTYAEPENLISEDDSDMEVMSKRMEYYNDNISDNSVVKVYKLYNKIFQFGEIMTTNVLDADDLSYQYGINLNDAPGFDSDRYDVLIQGAHGVHIPERNEFVNHVTLLDNGPPSPIPRPPKMVYALYKYHRTNETLTKEEIMATMEFSEPISLKTDMDIMYFHQGADTENYYVFPFTNLAFDDMMCSFKAIVQAKSAEACMSIHEEVPAQFVVLTKDTMEEVGRFQMDYFFGFHVINAYEDGEKIVMDFMTADKGADPFQGTYVDIVNATGQAYSDYYDAFALAGMTPERVVLDLALVDSKFVDAPKLATSWKLMDGATDNEEWMTYMLAGSDFPNVLDADRYNKDYDHFWSNGMGGVSVVDRIYHTQISTMERQVWQELGYHMSDPKLVTSPDGQETVLISIATPFELAETKGQMKKAFVVILDAMTLEEIGRAELSQDVRVCAMLHSYWVEGEHSEDDRSSSNLPKVGVLMMLFMSLLRN